MENNEKIAQQRKRPFCSITKGEDDDSDGEPSEKIVIEEPLQFGLQTICSELLLEIFKYLDSNSLNSLSRTCARFRSLVRDHRLWRKIDLTNEAHSLQFIRYSLRHIQRDTHTIKLRGLTESYPLDKWRNPTLSKALIKHIDNTCSNLQVLELYNSFLNCEEISINDFPKNLKKLTFHSCYAKMPPSGFFKTIHTHLKLLEELNVEYCNWFETHDLIAFSKLQFLKKFSLRGCDNLTNFVPYGSIVARFGFNKLEYLDVRDTPISDSDINCFTFTTTLKELLMQCPMESDKTKRKPTLQEVQGQSEQDPHLPGPSTSSANHNNTAPRIHVIPHGSNEGGLVCILVSNFSAINNRNDDNNANNNQPRIETLRVNAANLFQQNQNVAADPYAVFEARCRSAVAQSLWFERHFRPQVPAAPTVTDRGICGFGQPDRQVMPNMVWIRAEQRQANHNLERITVRNYTHVTDVSLQHLTLCSPNLVYLDLTGTSVTKEGVTRFRNEHPNCTVIVDHLTD